MEEGCSSAQPGNFRPRKGLYRSSVVGYIRRRLKAIRTPHLEIGSLPKTSPPWQIGLLLYGSGLCTLIYQTVWLREFRLIFGGSTAASAAVLAIFMGGLGLGGLLLGGTLPAAARAVVTSADAGRRKLALVYAANTLGAVTGVLLSTFALLEHYGNRWTLWLACALNALVALIAFLLARSPAASARASRGEETEKAQSSKLRAQSGTPRSALDTRPAFESTSHARFVYLAAGLSGFAFFLMELVWYRMLSPLLGGSVFTFGLILAVALLGVGLGGITYTLWHPRCLLSLEGLALTFGLEALCLAIPFALGDRVALLALSFRTLASVGFNATAFGWTLVAALVVFPASLVAGLQFPLLIALLGQGRDRVGRQVGLAWAWNTLGAVAGALAGGFGLLTLLSAPGTWRAVVVLLSLLSVAAVVCRTFVRTIWLLCRCVRCSTVIRRSKRPGLT